MDGVAPFLTAVVPCLIVKATPLLCNDLTCLVMSLVILQPLGYIKTFFTGQWNSLSKVDRVPDPEFPHLVLMTML